MSINPLALKEILLQDFIRYLRWSFKKKYNTKIILTESHIEVCKGLIRVYTGKSKKLIINLPPRFGKTEIVNTFIEWTITKHPESKYIMTSYADTLVANSSQQIRDMLTSDEHKDLFNIETKKDSKSKKLWKTSKGGGVYAVSSFGQITGHGAGLKVFEQWGGCIVIDDPLKPNDKDSFTMLDKVKDWYETTLSNRKNHPDTPIIIIMQRIHSEDLVGHILADEFKDAHEWDVVKVAVIDEDNKCSKWEEFYPYENISRIKLSNASYYYSQMQQEPVIAGGNFFQTLWIKYIPQSVIDTIKFERYFITADTALKDKEQNDYTVYSAWGVYENKLYWLDMYRGKPLSKQREVTAKDFYDRNYEYPFNGMYIEQKASGVDLFQRMQDDGYMVYEVERNVDKILRANDVSPYLETYKLHVREGLPNISEMLTEYEQFPNSKHDDIVDTLMDAVEKTYITEEIDWSRA